MRWYVVLYMNCPVAAFGTEAEARRHAAFKNAEAKDDPPPMSCENPFEVSEHPGWSLDLRETDDPGPPPWELPENGPPGTATRADPLGDVFFDPPKGS